VFFSILVRLRHDGGCVGHVMSHTSRKNGQLHSPPLRPFTSPGQYPPSNL
jgi:hypothetical protein